MTTWTQKALLNFEQQGYTVMDHWLSPAELSEAEGEFQELWQKDLFKKAQVVGTANRQIRHDWTLWWPPPKGPACPRLQAVYENLWSLIPVFNENFYCGVTSLEAHLALYPAGPGYEKHLDQKQGTRHRKITFVLYLNSRWSSEKGGALHLFSPTSPETLLTCLEPVGGRLVLFRSDLFPHEVRPSQDLRRSLTGWWRSDRV